MAGSQSTTPYLKKAHAQHDYSGEQIIELQKCSADPVYFALNYVMIQHPTKGAIKLELYPYQIKMLRAFHKHKNVIVLSARQTGKALALDTPIPTPTGWTTMGDIVVGSVVLGSDGRPTNVTGITDVMYGHVCYRVQFSNNEHIIADSDHLWEVRDSFTNKIVVLTTHQLLTHGNGPRPNGKTCRYSIATTQPLDLPLALLPVDPYVLGEEMGVINNKRIPMLYLRASKQQRIALLQGLMDAEGTIDNTRGRCELTLPDNKLAADVYELICSLGLKPTMCTTENSGVTTTSITFTPYTDDFSVFRLPRKLVNQRSTPDSTRRNSIKRRSILSIESVDSVPVRCITVDSTDHLFLAGKAMIPTHNSTVSAVYLLWFAMFHEDKTILIASNKNENAMELIYRCKFAYERLPNWLKPGLNDDGYNKHAIGFDNGSRINSTATSENSGRGMAISLLFCLGGNTLITVRNKVTGEIKNTTLEDMYVNLLYQPSQYGQEFVTNNEWEILGQDGNFYAFDGITSSIKKLRYVRTNSGGFWASNNHIFLQNGREIELGKLPKRCHVDGIYNKRIRIEKTNRYKYDNAFDIVECKSPNHTFVINNAIVTHNCDEFAFVRDSIAEEFWTAISPTLATGGDCIIASTPNGDTNLYASLWIGANSKSSVLSEEGVNGYVPIRVEWNEPPGRDEAFKEKETAKIGVTRWKQEYALEFISSDPTLIDAITLQNLTGQTKDIKPVGTLGEVVFFSTPVSGVTYLVGVDPSSGSGSDYTDFEVYEFPAMKQIAQFRSNTASTVISYHLLKKLLIYLENTGSTVYFSIENNGLGEALMALYEQDEHPPQNSEFISEAGQGRKGMATTGKSKIKACFTLKEMIERNTIKIMSRITVQELKDFVRKGGSYSAKYGATDDSVMSTIIVIRLLHEIASFDQDAYQSVYSHSYEVDGYDEYDEYNESNYDGSGDQAPLGISFG